MALNTEEQRDEQAPLASLAKVKLWPLTSSLENTLHAELKRHTEERQQQQKQNARPVWLERIALSERLSYPHCNPDSQKALLLSHCFALSVLVCSSQQWQGLYSKGATALSNSDKGVVSQGGKGQLLRTHYHMHKKLINAKTNIS